MGPVLTTNCLSNANAPFLGLGPAPAHGDGDDDDSPQRVTLVIKNLAQL